MSNGCIFYVTGKLLEEATKEMFSPPQTLSKRLYYSFIFELFQHKIRSKKDVAFMTFETLDIFQRTKHHDHFLTNAILNKTIVNDSEEIDYSEEITAIIEKASFKAGEHGDTDIIIVGTDVELAELNEKSDKYPVLVMSVEESKKRLFDYYNQII